MKTLRNLALSTSVVLATFFSSFIATAEVREITQMDQILSEVESDTLVIFDLDNTVIESKTSAGGDAWFSKMVADYVAAGRPEREAKDLAVARWSALQAHVDVEAVEATTPALIADLQSRGIAVIALTARPFAVSAETRRQIAQVGVSFVPTAISTEEIRFNLEREVVFRDGILEVNNTNKGVALLKLFERTEFTPGKILFVDDKHHNVTDVDAALTVDGRYEHIEYRYGAADAEVAAYNHELALLQESRLGRLLTDEEAKILLKCTDPRL